MTLLYRPKWTYTDHIYCRSICALAFSPDGTHLAYGSGENLCIMTVADKQLIFVIRGRDTPKGASAVNALVWLPQEKFSLLCAFQDGLIATITRELVWYTVETTSSSLTYNT